MRDAGASRAAFPRWSVRNDKGWERVMWEWVQVNFEAIFLNSFYDIGKFMASYLFARWLYDGVYKKKVYGGWQLHLIYDDQLITSRVVTPVWAERILKDENDFSVYVKGFASPYMYLNGDVNGPDAKTSGFICKNESAKQIIIDLAKNPEKIDFDKLIENKVGTNNSSTVGCG